MPKELYYIILGWLFGLLGSPLIVKIAKYYTRNDLKTAIFSELKSLMVRLAATYYATQQHLGQLNTDSLKWTKIIFEKYRADCPQKYLEAMNKVINSPPEQLATLTKLLKADENTSLDIKSLSIPFTESILSQLSIFNPVFQVSIFEIKAQFDILREQIENAKFYHRLTFDASCMETNALIIKNNLKNRYNDIQERCKIVADKIEVTLNS